ncbi:MAG: DCC1-like thiol-disulfide oxidoreductase family protein [Nitrososphaeraceae archaeon]
MSNYVMVYDADCGPCMRFKDAISILDRHKRIDFIPLIEADRIGFLNQVPQSLRFKSFHLISPAGEIRSGEDAIIDLIKLLPVGHTISKIIVSAPYGIQMIKFIYSKLSRLHDSSSCRVKDID